MTIDKLNGKFRTILASDSAHNKRLTSTLVIDKENGWHVEFHVESTNGTQEYSGLASAARAYDKIGAASA